MQLKNYLSFCVIGVLFLLPTASKAQTYGPVNAWFDTRDFIFNNFSGSVAQGIYMMLPDSGAYWMDEDGKRNKDFLFSAGHVFDLAHELWQAVPPTPKDTVWPVREYCPFTWDSLQFKYYYNRQHPDTSIVDTVFIYYYHNFGDEMLQTHIIDVDECESIVANPSKFDTATLSGEKYFRVDTVLLTSSYSTQFTKSKFGELKTYVGVTFTPSPAAQLGNFDRLFGFNMVFKPGYTISAGDTLFTYTDSFETHFNIFGGYVISPFYRVGTGDIFIPFYCTDEYVTNSIFVSNNSLNTNYKDSVGFIPSQGFYTPRYLWSAVYATSTSCPLSVKQPVNNKGEYLTISPNPTLAGSTATIEVNAAAPAPLKVQLRDVLGNLLFETDPKIIEGETTFKLNTPKNRGMYFIVLVDGKTNAVLATEKLLVTE
jgi:hypothetical protein